MSKVVGLPSSSYKRITNTAWVRIRLCIVQKRCTRFASASDQAYQLLAHGQWFSPGTSTSSTSKVGRHEASKIFLKVALNTINQIIKSTLTDDIAVSGRCNSENELLNADNTFHKFAKSYTNMLISFENNT